MKRCFKCGEEKELSCFYKHKQMKDGRLNKCKECSKKDVSANYRANIEHYREYERKREESPHRKAFKTTQGKKWRKRNPIKKMASTIVGNAVRDGRLAKPDNCEDCGSVPNRLHAHHDDYAFPLSVRWLCPGCHNKWHKENGEGLNGF